MRTAGKILRQWRNRRAIALSEAAEGGFTLIELLMVVVLLPLVIGMVAIVMITVFKTTNTHDLQGTAERLAESHDAQVTSADFVRDVQNSTVIETTTSPLCGSGVQLVGLEWNTNSTTTGPTYVSYVAETVGGSPAVERNYCTARSPGGTPVEPANDPPLTVSHDVLSITAATQALTCNALYASISGCVTGTSLQGPFASIYVSLVQVSIPEKSQTFTYVLKAAPRQLLASCSGSCKPPTPPLVLLGNTGANCASGNPSVTVNGTVAVDSSSSGSLAFHNGKLTAQQVYSQDTTGSPPVSPSSDYNYTGSSGQYSTGPIVNDGYSDLPVPNPSAPNTFVYNTALSGPNDGGSGLKSGVYILNAGITLNGNTSLTADAGGVFFYVQRGGVTIGGTASINLSSMSTGPYAGILLYQIPSDSSAMTLDGSGAATSLNGVIAAPSAAVQLKGGGSGSGLLVAGLEANSLSCNGNGSAVLGPPLGSITSVISSSNPSSSGASVTFTASVAASISGYPAPTGGTVTFTETPNGSAVPVTLCSGVSLSASSTATCSTSALIGGPASPYSVVATYSGTTGYSGSTSSPLSQAVQLTGITLASSANPSVSGQAVTFTATVTGGSGNVVFTIRDNANTSYTCSGGNTVSPSGGSAACAIASGILRSSLSTYSVSATYSSLNASLTQIVNKGSIHISAISGSGAPHGSKDWKAKVTVTVTDSFGNPVSGVSVTGSFSPSGPSPSSCSAPTNAGGQCLFTSGDIGDSVASETWSVSAGSGLSSSDYTWVPGSDTTENVVIPQ